MLLVAGIGQGFLSFSWGRGSTCLTSLLENKFINKMMY